MEVKSWRAIIVAAQGHYLLGGKKVHESSRFEKKHHAEAFAEAVSRTNRANGRMVARADVKPSALEPEIFQDDVQVLH